MGVASYKLLKHLGVDVDYPLDQTCCGQPMANAGFEDEATRMAIRMEELFRSFDYVVGPSASCVAFVKENHPHILEKSHHVCQNSQKIYDICEFIHDVVKPASLPAVFPHKVSLHNSCHGVRELQAARPALARQGHRGLRAQAGRRVLRLRRNVLGRGARGLRLYGPR